MSIEDLTVKNRCTNMQLKESSLKILMLALVFVFAVGETLQGQVSSSKEYASMQPQNNLIYEAPDYINGKNKRALNKIISIEFKDVHLLKALRKITDIAGIRLAFSKDVTLEKWDTKLNIEFKEATVLGALYAVLRAAEQEDITLEINSYGLLIVTDSEKTEEDNEVFGVFRGKVIDATTGESLVGANVILQNTSKGTATDVDGKFSVENVPEGEQTFEIRYLGFETKIVEVEILPDQVVEKEIALSPGGTIEGEDIVVLSQAYGQARAIREQLSSNTIVNVVSETRLRELPDANAAESIGRLPGVSILRDGGEGEKVAIRGMGPEFSSVTINGIRVPGTDGDRSLDLSMISSEMLSGIEVYKSIRPDMDADAMGGAVNFKMGGVPDETSFRARVESGYHNHISEVGNYKMSFSGSSRFLEDKLGVFVTANAQQIDRSANILASDYQVERDAREGEPHAPVRVVSLDLRDRSNMRQRYGGSVMLDWRLPNGKISLNNIYSFQNKDETSLERIYQLNSNYQYRRVRMRDVDLSTWNNSLAGEHDLSWMEIDWRVDRSVTLNEIPFNHLAEFRETSALDRSGVDLSAGPEVIPQTARNRVGETALHEISNELIDQSQENLSLILDLTIPTIISSNIEGEIKFGGKHYNNFREQITNTRVVKSYQMTELTGWAGSDHPWQLDSGGRPLMLSFLNDPETYTVINVNYKMANMPSTDIIQNLYDSHSDQYVYDQRSQLNDYEARERISSGYVMTEMDIGPRLMVLGGVRYEYEHSNFSAKLAPNGVSERDIRFAESIPALRDTTEDRNMGMLFPMIHLQYNINNWLDVRLARTESITRAPFSYLRPTKRLNYDQGSVNRGNTQIKPSKSTNYDAFLSANSNKIGLFTIGGFYKDIEDLIYMRGALIIDPEPLGLPDATRLFGITEPVNNEKQTTVYGIEVEWQSNLMWLPEPFNGLVINANFSRFFSEAFYHTYVFERTAQGFIGRDTYREAPMVHQADYIANASIGYDFKNFSARFSLQYQGPTLRAIGSRPETDQFTDGFFRIDASIRQKIVAWQFSSLSVFANLNNLNSREDRSSQFTKDRPRAIEQFGATFDAGVEFSF